MTIAPFPHKYTLSLVDDHLVAPQRASVPIGAPPQFGGSADVWSPEELLGAATLSCLKTTFDAYARREQLIVLDWIGRATVTLEKSAHGPVVTSVALELDLVVEAKDGARAREIVERAEKRCIISAALKAPVTLAVHIEQRHEAPSHGAA